MSTHLFGKIDSPCCANYALKESKLDNVDLNPAVIKAIENDFYMDNFLISCSSTKYLTDITKSFIANLINHAFALQSLHLTARTLSANFHPQK